MSNERKSFKFECSKEFGELVMFRPGNEEHDGSFLGVIEGVTMLRGKVSYHVILASGACITTYSERIHRIPSDTTISAEDAEWLDKALYGNGIYRDNGKLSE